MIEMHPLCVAALGVSVQLRAFRYTQMPRDLVLIPLIISTNMENMPHNLDYHGIQQPCWYVLAKLLFDGLELR